MKAKLKHTIRLVGRLCLALPLLAVMLLMLIAWSADRAWDWIWKDN